MLPYAAPDFARRACKRRHERPRPSRMRLGHCVSGAALNPSPLLIHHGTMVTTNYFLVVRGCEHHNHTCGGRNAGAQTDHESDRDTAALALSRTDTPSIGSPTMPLNNESPMHEVNASTVRAACSLVSAHGCQCHTQTVVQAAMGSSAAPT